MPYVKGQSGNISGRPRGARGIAAYVQSQTDGGRELIDGLLAIARNSSGRVGLREQGAALMALLDRAIGKPETTSSVTMSVASRWSPPHNFYELPEHERMAYLDSLRSAAVGGSTALQLTEGDDVDEE